MQVSKRRRALELSLFLLVAALLSTAFAFYRGELNVMSGSGSPQAIMRGVGEKPFQYRVLVPWLVGMSSRLGIPQVLGISGPAEAFRAVDGLALFFLVVVFRIYLGCFLSDPSVASLCSFSLFLVLPHTFLLPRHLPVFYASDIPSLIVLTLGMVCLFHSRWGGFYAVFVLGTFNRETTCFLTFAYIATAWGRRPWKEIATHAAVQFGLWVTAKASLASVYAENPGGAFQWTLWGAMKMLLEPGRILETAAALASYWLPALLFFGRIRSSFVRRGALATIPMFLGLLMVGNLDEPRAWADLIPFGLSASILAIHGLVSESERPPLEAPPARRKKSPKRRRKP